MHELQWWVVILFCLIAFDRMASLFGRFSRWADERGNGHKTPVTVMKLRQELGIPLTGRQSFMEAASETHKIRFETLISSVNALTQINGRLLDQIKELVSLERARIELRQQGE